MNGFKTTTVVVLMLLSFTIGQDGIRRLLEDMDPTFLIFGSLACMALAMYLIFSDRDGQPSGFGQG
ncbi:hypothetical protein AUJ14_05000 [Candidatus Micrarchaeota archaeon CG1_02_55_22]|nr:MAG: hypothetical protein AUJ14_05000 [Candidatus Micrarchaeota archaeon CG1_02_55_22]